MKDPHIEVEQLVLHQRGMLCIIYHDERGKQETEWKTERRGRLGFVHLVSDQKIGAISTSLWTLVKWEFGTTSTSISGDWDRECSWSWEPRQTNWDDRQEIIENVLFSVCSPLDLPFLKGWILSLSASFGTHWIMLVAQGCTNVQETGIQMPIHNLGSGSSWFKSRLFILSITIHFVSRVFGHLRHASPIYALF